MYRGKRAFDLVVATLALLVLSPVLLIASAWVALRLGRPVLFRQPRAGLRGEPFTLCKFRTMTNERGPDGALLPDEQRLTPAGAFLRTTTLDELPSLWNVVKGDMSLVGPRPLFVQYTPLYTEEQARRLDVRPGLTGWAVVQGRNAIPWEERFRLDAWYVDHCSFPLDMKILALTVKTIVSRKGVSQKGHATMPHFRGADEARQEDGTR